MRYSPYILLLPLLVVLSCEKEEETPAPQPTYRNAPCSGPRTNTPIDSSLFVYEYKVGTYWIFVDSANAFIDSSIVTHIRQEGMWYPCFSYDKYELEITSYPSGEKNSYDIIGNSILKGSYSETINYPVDHNPTNSDDFTSVHYDSLFILNKYYYKVTKNIIFTNYNGGSHETRVYYMNPEFGFLRIDSYDPSNVLVFQKFLSGSHIVR